MLKIIHTLDCGLFPVNSAAFSSEGILFASASGNGTIRLWNAEGILLRTLNGHDEPVDCVTFSPNNKLLMSASDNHYTPRLWNVDDGTVQELLVGDLGPVAFSPDGTTRASCSGGGRVSLLGAGRKTLEVGQPILAARRFKRHHRMLDGWPADVTALAFSPDGSLLACGYDNGMLKLWEMTSEYAEDHPGHEDAIIALAFSPDGKILASASHSGAIMLWDVRKARYTCKLQGSWVGVHRLAFSTDGKLLASASFDKQIRLWDLATRTLLHEVEAAGTICALSFLRSIRIGVCDDQAQGSYSIDICEIAI